MLKKCCCIFGLRLGVLIISTYMLVSSVLSLTSAIPGWMAVGSMDPSMKANLKENLAKEGENMGNGPTLGKVTSGLGSVVGSGVGALGSGLGKVSEGLGVNAGVDAAASGAGEAVAGAGEAASGVASGLGKVTSGLGLDKVGSALGSGMGKVTSGLGSGLSKLTGSIGNMPGSSKAVDAFHKTISSTKTLMAIASGELVLRAIFNSLNIIGVLRKTCLLVFAWLIYHAIAFTGQVIFSIVMIITATGAATATFGIAIGAMGGLLLILCFVYWYFWLVVLSYYQQLKKEVKEEEAQREDEEEDS